jgi:hypothetical protein
MRNAAPLLTDVTLTVNSVQVVASRLTTHVTAVDFIHRLLHSLIIKPQPKQQQPLPTNLQHFACNASQN